jgi:hypothetical protein
MSRRIDDPETGTVCCFWMLQLPSLRAFQLLSGVLECDVICASASASASANG